ncbi:hypothetical protein [uncultured Arcobacter sp.]|uniref:hypothetical protein n=1 Tax=uncultured Arcobacter sp. TaxID=165434 RepID=UPI0026349586|nr:hypothetical protein [uncultured Arcobacter sp.]
MTNNNLYVAKLKIKEGVLLDIFFEIVDDSISCNYDESQLAKYDLTHDDVQSYVHDFVNKLSGNMEDKCQ